MWVGALGRGRTGGEQEEAPVSAYVVNKAHIDALVRTADEGPCDRTRPRFPNAWGRDLVRTDGPDRVGAMLLAANLASVRYRYAESDPESMVPDWARELYLYERRTALQLTIVGALKALDGYEYQACEDPQYDGSKPDRWVESMRRRLIHELPGYAEADWSIA